MARAETITWLPLDRWIFVLDGDPLHFNGLVTELRPQRTGCEDTWLQFGWQNTQQVSRESLAEAIQDAEEQISAEVGYNLLPDWRIDERQLVTRVGNRELFSVGQDIRGKWKSRRVDKGHIISGGMRSKTAIGTNAAVVRSDPDGDGYDELATVTVATTITDTDEIRVYFPGESGADEWEVRPLDSITADGANATITFKIWLLVDPDLQIALNSENAINGDTAGNFLSTVDVFRVFNDPETQVQFLWEPFPQCACDGTTTCSTCQHSTQNGCLTAQDFRMGWFQYTPATYDSDTGEFSESQYSLSREPDQLRLWYYSGFRDNRLDRPRQQMARYWERAVTYLSMGLLDREICQCDNVLTFYQYWREDLGRIDENRTHLVERFLANNPFSVTTRGAYYAWQQINRRDRKLPD